MGIELKSGSTQIFRLPDLGEGLTEAGLVQWLVAVGDTIVTDQPIAEVETAKSVVELPSPFAGVVTALHGAVGDTINVGTPVLEVSDAGAADANLGEVHDSRSFRAASSEMRADLRSSDTATGEAVEHQASRQGERAGSGNVLIGYGTRGGAASGRRRRPASKISAELQAAPAPRILPSPASDEAPVVRELNAVPRSPVAVRSPLVRRLARDLGLDVHTIVATGPDGAVTRADVLRAAVDSAVDGAAAHHRETTGTDTTGTGPTSPRDLGTGDSGTGETVDGLAVRSRERMSPLRKAVSAKLSHSRAEIPEATVWVDVDATTLWDLRAGMAPEGCKAPSVTALLARFVLLALADYPVLASRLSADAGELISFEGVNLGVAADTERGLMVPVIPAAHALSVEQLDAALRELAAAARSGSMPPERLRGSTFTLNNYGGLGVDGSAAIINHPDVAILGLGRIIERPWVIDGEIVVRRIAQLSLVFDHRVCDGGYAAGFLRRVSELVEHPLRAFGRV